MINQTQLIVLCGPESTGKSDLSHFLSSKFQVPEIQEIARTYIESKQYEYLYEDVEAIAKLQIESLENLLKEQPKAIILDTWLIITKVWFEVVYQKEPEWLDKALRTYPIDHYLLCEPDLPWEPDPVRENPNRREELFNRYEALINQFGFTYTKISGLGDDRRQRAAEIVKNILKDSSVELSEGFIVPGTNQTTN